VGSNLPKPPAGRYPPRVSSATNGRVDVGSHIRSRLSILSPNERRIAAWLLEHMPEAAFETADSLARKVGVSKAAVVRFGSKLGFGGFAGLHDAIAEGAMARLIERAAPLGAPRASLLDRWLAAASADLIATRRSVSDELLESAAELLRAPGGRTFVFGQRKSAALAEYAFFLLNPLIPHVLTIEEGAGTVADALIDVGPDDRLLAVTFRPYARLTADVIDWFARAGGAVVLVCDDPLIPQAAHAQHTLVCAPESPGPFASAVAGLFVVEALAAYVAAGTPGGTERRLGAAQELWARFGTY
jgi:DNA-binding MurR/RpiR family transcriptional regulator